MKIKFMFEGYDETEEAYVADFSKTLDLCGQGLPEGSAKGLVPVLGTDGSRRTNVSLELMSSTTTNKKGGVSSVVKVTMPYVRETQDEAGSTVWDDKNLGSVSVHMVIALPPAAVQDLKLNSTVSATPRWHVAQLIQLLLGLLGPGVATYPIMRYVEGGHMAPSGPFPYFDESCTTGPAEDPAAAPHVVSDSFGGIALSMQTMDTAAKPVDDVLVRIANKLAPLSCKDVTVKPIAMKVSSIS